MKQLLPSFFFILTTLLFWPAWLDAQQWDTLAAIPENFTFPVVDVLDGKIHILGGGGTGGATDHHYAYDPATDTWESRAPVPYKAQQPAGAAVNGKLHFFGGGFPNSGSPLDDHYIYDPSTDSWSPSADLTAPRAIHYGVGLDGLLYSLAGQGMANLCQTYDPATDEWMTKNNLPDNGFWYGAHVATEGHIYRFCGGGYTAPNDNAHRYDPGTDTWEPLPDFPAATHALKGAAIGNKIYLAGGYHDFLERDEVFIFDTQTEEYTTGTPLPLGRNYHNMVALDSCIYVVGGNHAIDESVKTQLIRFCPFETASATKEKLPQPSLSAHYQSGILTLRLPEGLPARKRLALYDLGGRMVLLEKLPADRSGVFEIRAGDLPPSIYIVQVKAGQSFLHGKLLVH